MGAEQDVEFLVPEDLESGVEPGVRRGGEGGDGVRFSGVGGEGCEEEEAGWGEDVDLVVLLGEDRGDLARGQAACVCEEDLHFER